MGITDASTSLSTSWTEKSVVDITAGNLSDLDACVTEVESKLNRGTLGASSTPTETQVKQWLVRAKEELAEVKGFSFNRKYASMDLTADQYRYSLPPDYNGGPISIRDQDNDRYIPVWPTSFFDKKFPDLSEETSGEVMVACIKNYEIWFAPPADDTDSLELEYNRSGAETTTDDFAWLPELERFRCCDFAVAESFEALGQLERAQIYRRKWLEGVQKAIRAEGNRKWNARGYQIINVFQERTLLANQP